MVATRGQSERPACPFDDTRTVTRWTVEYEGASFELFYRRLPDHAQAVLAAAIENVLAVHGMDVCSGEWGKALGGGLYEFRIRRSLNTILTSAGLEKSTDVAADRPTLLRVFCTFHGDRIVLLFHGYDKGRDPSAQRQRREIAKARKLHDAWKRRDDR